MSRQATTVGRPPARGPVCEEIDPECPRCGGNLALHQPHCDLPDRLLAACDDCLAWYLTGSDRSRYYWLDFSGDVIRLREYRMRRES